MSGKRRVDFNVPEELVAMADAVAELRGVNRTVLLTEALERELEETLSDETFREALRSQYLSGKLDRETVVTLLGEAETVRLDLLGRLVERDLPTPDADVALPDDEEFYGQDPPAVEGDERQDERGG
ncbi:hypothetical protein BRD10_03805 [Halobacteriales archaeon SW_12_71_31]|nr:MAG: hypothetical protein BRD10_03805 [Halobacteriales archaeon SW_12_71_31]